MLASRVEGGSVSTDEVTVIKGLIAAGDLSPIKARVLLMLALAQGLRGPDLERVFREYLRCRRCRALSTAGLEATDGPAFERYDARFDPRTGSGGFEIWVPVSAESLTVRT